MDWNNVTAEELLEALREVDLKYPRPPLEFFGRSLVPKSHQWASRVKCNLYYYRTNYLLILASSLILVFVRNPLALLAVLLLLVALMCLNEPFCSTLKPTNGSSVYSVCTYTFFCVAAPHLRLWHDKACTDQLLHIVRKVHPRTAQRARALAGQEAVVATQRRSSRNKRKAYIVLVPRAAVVGGLLSLSGVLVYFSRAWITLSWGILLGVGLPLLHATLRSPNLKARLASAREEFKAVWRGYQAELMHDYSL